jgi:hypothetical protein
VRLMVAIFAATLGGAIALGWGSHALAAPTKPGITISPINLSLDLRKGDDATSGTINVRNDYSRATEFTAAVRGMQLSGDSSLVPSDSPELALAASLVITPSNFTLEPGQSIDVRVTLSNSAKLSPGGHYASVLIRQTADTGNSLSLNPAISVAIFVIKEDGAIRAVKISSVDSGGSIFNVPHSLTANFDSLGNVSMVPRAAVSVYDPLGHMVASGVLNTGSVPIYPNKSVRLETHLISLALGWVPGRYKEQVLYRYDGTDTQQVAVAYKWVVPLPFLAVLAACLVLLAGGIRLGWVLYSNWRAKKQRAKAEETAPKRQPRSFDIIVNGSAARKSTSVVKKRKI